MRIESNLPNPQGFSGNPRLPSRRNPLQSAAGRPPLEKKKIGSSFRDPFSRPLPSPVWDNDEERDSTQAAAAAAAVVPAAAAAAPVMGCLPACALPRRQGRWTRKSERGAEAEEERGAATPRSDHGAAAAPPNEEPAGGDPVVWPRRMLRGLWARRAALRFSLVRLAEGHPDGKGDGRADGRIWDHCEGGADGQLAPPRFSLL